jgi:hypothetical protein
MMVPSRGVPLDKSLEQARRTLSKTGRMGEEDYPCQLQRPNQRNLDTASPTTSAFLNWPEDISRRTSRIRTVRDAPQTKH